MEWCRASPIGYPGFDENQNISWRLGEKFSSLDWGAIAVGKETPWLLCESGRGEKLGILEKMRRHYNPIIQRHAEFSKQNESDNGSRAKLTSTYAKSSNQVADAYAGSRF